MPQLANRNCLLAVIIFSVLLVLGWFVYSPALSGTFLLDDHGNLDGLLNVTDWQSALTFVASGDSGPLGRPIALASFLPQAGSMESGARAFLQFNILLHLFNAGILSCFLYRLSLSRETDQRTALFVAVTAAAIWLFMPLLASASMMVVQRMTTLCATFVFLSLVAYLHARRAIDNSPNRALTGMGMAVVAGTALAVLVKENGALLPTLILAMEATVLSRPKAVNVRVWRAWISVFLIVPTLMIVGYLATRVPYSEALVLRRDFTGWERLLTESRILWEYLINAFVPQPAHFGPFHDGYPVARTILDPLTFASFAGWLIAAGLGILWRRRYPVAAFAVLWFLGGHLLESTVLQLELYFEHRNYVPIVGPVFALCFLAAGAPVAKKKLVYAGLPLYALANAAALAGIASLWGQPAVAAHLWHERHPDSVRAATEFASYDLALNGPERVLQTLNEFVRKHPNDGYLKIQELKLRCIFPPANDHQQVLADLKESLNNIDFDYISVTALSQLAITVSETECEGVDLETVQTLAENLLRNPRYRQDALYNQIHHQVMARIAQLQKNYPEAIRHLERAIEYKPDARINAVMVSLYATSHRYSEARTFIQSARENAPLNPLKRYEWMSILDDLGQFMNDVERESTADDEPR